MEVVRTVRELRARLDGARARGHAVGMVGTSGGMHRGHLSLIERAAAHNDVSVLFWGGGSASDWMTTEIGYERDADRDFALADGAGLDILFAPLDNELFPREPATKVSLPAFSADVPYLEDPAHLDLIAMVMCKLWNFFGACRSYFGEKDWQQLAMYKRLAEDLAWPVEVIGCPTVREDDGLAVSSRNGKLTPEERAEAPVLYRALRASRDATLAGARAAEEVAKVFAEEVADVAAIRYFRAVEAATMRSLDEVAGEVRLLASVEIGSVRLVDNVGITIT